MPEEQLTIGELADHTGVATSALRYWEQVGLLPAPVRVSGQRRYPRSAVELVGVILLFRDTGFTVRELAAFLVAGSWSADEWRELAQRKLTELENRIAQARAAHSALTHALACTHENLLECPNFGAALAARLAGSSPSRKPTRLHRSPLGSRSGDARARRKHGPDGWRLPAGPPA